MGGVDEAAGAGSPAGAQPADIAGRIQDALLGRAVTAQQVRDHIAGAIAHGFDAVVLPGCWVALGRETIAAAYDEEPAGARTGRLGLGSILDFPYGAAGTATRVAGARAVVQAGADQIDATVNIGLLLSGRYAEFAADLRAVVEAAAPVPVKFMLELPLLDAGQRARVVAAAVEAGAAYVKNASRGAVGIADAATIAYLRSNVPESVGVKASGGIRTMQQVRELLAAGADLIGTSSGVAIVTGQRAAPGTLYSY